MNTPREKKNKSFICFTNNNGVGGLIADKIYDTLKTYINKEDIFFSSAYDRCYGDNYREKELLALKESQYFILVLTNELIDGLDKKSETLFEIKTALENTDTIKIIPVATKDFSWEKKRVRKIIKMLNEKDAQYLTKIDYVSFFGVREYEKITGPEILKAMGITPHSLELKSVVDIKNKILNTQKEKMFISDNDSILGNELLYFQQNLNIEPRKKIDGMLSNDSINDKILNSFKNNNAATWFVLGEVGSGKTTFIRKIYSTFSQNTDDFIVPIFLHSNEVKSLNFDKEELFRKHLKNLGLSVSDSIMQHFLENTKICFFTDAIDEVFAGDYSTISTALNQRSKNCFYIISCRKNIFQYLKIENVDHIVEILGLSNNQKLQIINQFFTLECISNDKLKETVKNAVITNEIFNNILFIVILFLLLKDQSTINFYMPINRFDMLDKIILWTIYREKKKGLIDIDLEQIFNILYKVAFLFLKRKGLSEKILFNELQYELAKEEDIYLNRSLLKLFISINPLTNECTFAHEQFYEFIIAKYFITLLAKQNSELTQLLSYGFSIETNQMITEQFVGSQNKTFFLQLKEAYFKVPSCNYRAKLHILNHMHRTLLYSDIKKFILDQLKDTSNEIDYILLFHSLVVAGDSDDENNYFNKLKRDPLFEQLNANITLSYYYDKGSVDSFPASDDGSKSWYPVFVGYKNHIKKRLLIPHYYRILRINMFTANTYIQTRKYVDEEIACFYMSLNEELKKDTSPFGQEIYKEYTELCSTIKKYIKRDI